MCRVDGVINEAVVQDNANQINVGDFIKIASFPDCTFEVVSTDIGPANATITEILDIRGCSAVCNNYSLTNDSNAPITVNYINCANQGAQTTIAALTSQIVCARDFVSLDPNIILLLSSCDCTEPE